MTATKTLEEVVAMLDLDSAEAVADLLREHGVRATRETPRSCSCPVAIFARRQTGEPVSVSPLLLRFWKAPAFEGIALPTAVVAFIHRFDNSDPAFADLVAAP